jgi:hypothetical protein
MPEKLFEMDIFSFERTSSTPSASFATRQYFPFESAWKEFDRLHQTIHHGGPVRFALSVLELALLSVGTLGLHVSKESKLIILIGWVALAALGLFRFVDGRSRFLHWECPRCHSEWPSSKDEKDRACKVCGLRLHQLSP